MKKNYFLTMLALLFLFSCTREYLMESNDTIQFHSNSRVNKVSFEEMENFIQKNAKNTLPDYLKPNNLNKNTKQYITAIDTADIIKVVHNDITSFTLKVNTVDDKDFTFSNLVINVHNGNIEEYIYNYIPDAQWLKNYIINKKGDYQGVLKITDINGNNKTENHAKNSTTCMVEMHVPCFGAGCPCSDYNGVTYYIMDICTTGGGSGSSGGNTGGPPSGGGGGGTVPNVPTTEQINNFIAFLSPSSHAYITENIGALTDIINYFSQNGLAPKHQGFITSVLEYVTKKNIAWSSFNPIFTSAVAYKNQNPNEWTSISTIQDFAFDFMLQNPTISWLQFQNEFITFPPPHTAIPNIQDFLSVFDIHQSANLTVYAQKMFGGNGVGHAFISISQGNNVRTYGFYPKLGFPANTNGPGIFGNNSGFPYTFGWNLGTISSTQLQQIIGNSIAFSHSDYNILMNNCSDFALYALQVVGVNAPTSGIDTPNTVINIISSHAQYTNGNAP
ncbi:hypothetical protein G6R40_02105 [Chryseobacterium sp. POL2]|uniref:hypothetical protein n=1 Tax=Chryseobacterium sp. POL2 TaxID=2713414 RepID=UPI0013E17BC8|nr:hypothetical protein [Chryseobacterium sp. POL2]QIG88525.1 hypothetical protein G6R40_02105 [Chryseobacterium sp. POL2]